jgi:hypothetical protein
MPERTFLCSAWTRSPRARQTELAHPFDLARNTPDPGQHQRTNQRPSITQPCSATRIPRRRPRREHDPKPKRPSCLPSLSDGCMATSAASAAHTSALAQPLAETTGARARVHPTPTPATKATPQSLPSPHNTIPSPLTHPGHQSCFGATSSPPRRGRTSCRSSSPSGGEQGYARSRHPFPSISD